MVVCIAQRPSPSLSALRVQQFQAVVLHAHNLQWYLFGSVCFLSNGADGKRSLRDRCEKDNCRTEEFREEEEGDKEREGERASSCKQKRASCASEVVLDAEQEKGDEEETGILESIRRQGRQNNSRPDADGHGSKGKYNHASLYTKVYGGR